MVVGQHNMRNCKSRSVRKVENHCSENLLIKRKDNIESLIKIQVEKKYSWKEYRNFKGWSNDSEIKRSHCSCRGHAFDPSTQIKKLTPALCDRLFLGRCNTYSIHPREGNYESKVTVLHLWGKGFPSGNIAALRRKVSGQLEPKEHHNVTLHSKLHK